MRMSCTLEPKFVEVILKFWGVEIEMFKVMVHILKLILLCTLETEEKKPHALALILLSYHHSNGMTLV